MSHELDDTIIQFLQNKVNSFIKWDLVRFYHDNPHTQDTAENLARYTGRDVKTVEYELEGLANTGVLVAETVSGFIVYRLVDDADVLQTIDRFMTACHNRQFRVKAIHEVIRGMQFPGTQD